MNAIVKTEPQKKLMLLEFMADKYSLNPDEFSKTVRATCGLLTATPEQFAAFLIVSKEYDLNPLTKEIYAFPGKGGGIVPIVSVDGWVNLVNSHDKCDGFEFADEHDDNGALVSYTCTMHRKDRTHPTIVTEYLSECIRNTEPWKMKNRMLRHKSFIQAARYAFGFAGIYDEDEGRVIAEAVDMTRDAAPPRNVTKTIEHQPEVVIPDEELLSYEDGRGILVIEPHELVPLAKDSFEAWAKRYMEVRDTSPDTATVFKWIDANKIHLKKLDGSAKWSGEVKRTTEELISRLRPPTDEFPSDTPMEAVTIEEQQPPRRGRPPKPNMDRDYDGWVNHYLRKISECKSVDEIEEIFAAIDGEWERILSPDRESLMGARRETEAKMEP